jgi:hypothetical protein
VESESAPQESLTIQACSRSGVTSFGPGKQDGIVRDWSEMATIKIVEKNARIFARDKFHCVYCDYDVRVPGLACTFFEAHALNFSGYRACNTQGDQ